jgi:hypothetical protein
MKVLVIVNETEKHKYRASLYVKQVSMNWR